MDQLMNDDMYIPKPFIPTVTFADGSTIDALGSTTSDESDLWIWPADSMSLIEAVQLFSNVSKTESIICKTGYDIENTYIGYTFLDTIQSMPDNKITVRLKQPKV